MKKAIGLSMILLTVISVFAIFALQIKGESEVITLPGGAWHWSGKIDSNSGLDRIDMDPTLSGDQQVVTVSPGETITFNYWAWVYGWGSGGYEIRQLWFAYSWASSWPPWDAYTGIYDGIPHGTKNVDGSVSITVPTTPGTYKVWLCVDSHYSMSQAVAQLTEEPTMLPHAKIVVAPSSDYQLTTNPLLDDEPSWSPDGAKIVYYAFAGSWYRHIWAMSNDGSGKTQLTSGSVVDEAPAFSPDGTKMAFQRWGFRGDYFDIMIMDADGSNVQRITYSGVPGKREGTFEHPRWSEDGTRLVFHYGEGTTGPGSSIIAYWICTINVDGTGLEVLGRGMNPRFCYGDTKVLFNTDPFYEDGQCIALMNADGTGMQILTEGPNDVLPHMSSTTNRILFNRGGDLYVMDADGSNLASITTDGTNGFADWSPDEEYIVYSSAKSGNWDIWKIDAPPTPPVQRCTAPYCLGYKDDNGELFGPPRRGKEHDSNVDQSDGKIVLHSRSWANTLGELPVPVPAAASAWATGGLGCEFYAPTDGYYEITMRFRVRGELEVVGVLPFAAAASSINLYGHVKKSEETVWYEKLWKRAINLPQASGGIDTNVEETFTVYLQEGNYQVFGSAKSLTLAWSWGFLGEALSDFCGEGGVWLDEIIINTKEAIDYALKVTALSPVHIMVTDPLGSRVGYDLATDQVVKEIPGAMYSGPGSKPQLVIIPDPLDGHYVLDLMGTAGGAYTLTIELMTSAGAVSQTFTGETVEGAVYVYSASIADELMTVDPDSATELEHLKEFIMNLPDDVFITNDPDEFVEFKKEMVDKIDEAFEEFYENKYMEAIEKLGDMREEVIDEDRLQASTRSDLCVVLDHIISSIETLQ